MQLNNAIFRIGSRTPRNKVGAEDRAACAGHQDPRRSRELSGAPADCRSITYTISHLTLKQIVPKWKIYIRRRKSDRTNAQFQRASRGTLQKYSHRSFKSSPASDSMLLSKSLAQQHHAKRRKEIVSPARFLVDSRENRTHDNLTELARSMAEEVHPAISKAHLSHTLEQGFVRLRAEKVDNRGDSHASFSGASTVWRHCGAVSPATPVQNNSDRTAKTSFPRCPLLAAYRPQVPALVAC